MKILDGFSYVLSDIPDGVHIGKYCSVAGGVRFHVKCDHACIVYRDLVSCFPFRGVMGLADIASDPVGKGDIYVGNDVWIAEAARIMSGVKIGDGAIIGADCVVTHDVPPYALYAGNPGRVKKYRFNKKQIAALLKIKWWDWKEQDVRDRIRDFENVDHFINKYEKSTTDNS